ncbi:hypothetical protein [Sphingomonas sp.]|uniref:hypothetical protein n=1 Tax=Sphingomonas sp. TaxID=28214 RepID=UPI001B1AAB8B|nr:hypothetical protein [Sphingomonas sp.]MBO9712465.1 hypothetical protein [Sphingomonas sp.]
MQHDTIPDDVRTLAFEFFYWFSRFEFALKENGYLKSRIVGTRAEPSWQGFVDAWQGDYEPTSAAKALIAANPQQQIVGPAGLEFRDVHFAEQPSDLKRVVRLAQTVRNNLFHGGKHGNESWDDPNRMRLLLPTTIVILGEFADRAGITADYDRYY